LSGRRRILCARATGHESPARFPRRAGFFFFTDVSGTSPSDFVMDRFIGSSSPGSIFFEIRFTKIDGCRIKSGHDGCVLWREVRQRFTHYFQIQFSNSQGNSERDASAKTVIARSEATKQSILPLCIEMDCFASLAMTWKFQT
jgi:hypothetical protein